MNTQDISIQLSACLADIVDSVEETSEMRRDFVIKTIDEKLSQVFESCIKLHTVNLSTANQFITFADLDLLEVEFYNSLRKDESYVILNKFFLDIIDLIIQFSDRNMEIISNTLEDYEVGTDLISVVESRYKELLQIKKWKN